MRLSLAAACGAIAAMSACADGQTRNVTYPRTPLAFERNVGQTRKGVQYLARYGGGVVFLQGDRATLTRKAARLTVRFAGGNANAQPVSGATLPTRVNYLRGSDPSRWITGLSTHKRVRFREVYPGIDVVYYGARAGSGAKAGPDVLEFDCEVKPGADPARIQLAFDGADTVRIEAGVLVARARGLEIRLRKPVSYQMVGARRLPVASKWTLSGSVASATPRAALRIARYDRTRTLVVDPVLFLFSTRFGGSDVDQFNAVAEVPNGYQYPIVTVGQTESTDYPQVWPHLDYAGGTDAVVTVWNWNLEYPALSNYIGGSGDDAATCAAIVIDGNGQPNVFVAGTTTSTDFPLANASQTANAGGADGFVARVNGWDGTVAYSTYYGGSGDDSIVGLAPDGESVVVAGSTTSSDLPGTAFGYQPASGGGSDGFLAAFTPSGQLDRATYFGGPSDDYVTGIARYGSYVNIGGYCGDGLPIVGVAFQPDWAGGTDGFVAGLTPDLMFVDYSTYLGGWADDRILGIFASDWGIFVTGETFSDDFPTILNPIQIGLNGPSDAFAAHFENGVEQLTLSTYLGGTGDDAGTAIWHQWPTLGSQPVLTVAGRTTSTDFPVANAFQATNGGGSDGFIARIETSGTTLVDSSYLGGLGDDAVTGMSVDLWGEVLVVGSTGSPDFPSERVPWWGNSGAPVDGFITLIAPEYLGTGGYLMWPSGAPGETVTFEAGINGPKIPLEGRIIEFSVDGAPVGTALTNYWGTAYLAYTIPPAMPPGTHTMRMDYAGEAAYTPVWIEVPFTVTGARDTFLFVLPRTTTNGRIAYLRGYLFEKASRAPVAGETLEFAVDGTVVGSAVTIATGRATLEYYGPYAEGTWPLVVSYAGNATYGPSSGSSTITISKGDLYLWAYGRSNVPGATTRLHCYVRSVPDRVPVGGREISFSVDGTFVGVGTSAASGWAETLWTIPLGTASGPHAISLEFAGDTAYHPATGSGTVNVL